MNKYEECVSRSTILGLLSDDEIAAVSTAETAPRLADGEEYIDLSHLGRGVQRATGYSAPMDSILPRSAVRDVTWKAVVGALGGSR